MLQGAENWIKSQAVKGSKKIFLYNLSQQLANTREALSMEKMYTERVEQAFEGLHATNAHLITDDRSRYHLQSACLVLAAYRVLTDQLNLSSEQTIQILQRCMGDSDSAGERAVRYSLSMCSKLMFRDPFDALKATSRQMADVDMGKSFTVAHAEAADGNQHTSTVSRCFYHSFLSRHGAPELTGAIFCKAEEALFEKASGMTGGELRSGAVTFELSSSLARGHAACSFEVKRQRRDEA